MFRWVLGTIYNRMKRGQGVTGANQYKQSGTNCQSAQTSKKLAKQYGVQEITVRRAGKFAKEVEQNPELAEAILNQRWSFHKCER